MLDELHIRSVARQRGGRAKLAIHGPFTLGVETTNPREGQLNVEDPRLEPAPVGW